MTFFIKYSSAKAWIVLIMSNAIVDFPLAVSPAIPIEQALFMCPEMNSAILWTVLSFTFFKIESFDFVSSENILFNFFSFNDIFT